MEGRGATVTYFWETGWVPFTILWNITGQPAASVPAGFSREGLPLAVQIVGRPGDERNGPRPGRGARGGAPVGRPAASHRLSSHRPRRNGHLSSGSASISLPAATGDHSGPYRAWLGGSAPRVPIAPTAGVESGHGLVEWPVCRAAASLSRCQPAPDPAAVDRNPPPPSLSRSAQHCLSVTWRGRGG